MSRNKDKLHRKSRDGIPNCKMLMYKATCIPTNFNTPVCILLYLPYIIPNTFLVYLSCICKYNVHVHVTLLISTTATFFILLVPKTHMLPHLMGWHITLIVVGVLALSVFIVIVIIIIVVSFHQMGELKICCIEFLLKIHSCMVEFTISRNLSVCRTNKC